LQHCLAEQFESGSHTSRPDYLTSIIDKLINKGKPGRHSLSQTGTVVAVILNLMILSLKLGAFTRMRQHTKAIPKPVPPPANKKATLSGGFSASHLHALSTERFGDMSD